MLPECWRPLSDYPHANEHALLFVAPPVGCYLISMVPPSRDRPRSSVNAGVATIVRISCCLHPVKCWKIVEKQCWNIALRAVSEAWAAVLGGPVLAAPLDSCRCPWLAT